MIDAETALVDVRIAGLSAAEASFARHFRGNPRLITPALQAGVDHDAPVAAQINHGRWIVECPDGDGGAQFASREDPRFLCVECLNLSIAGKWRLVVWPDELEQIEALLEARPVPHQNWAHGETATQLAEENATNGANR